MYWLDTTILAVLGIGAVFGALSGLVMQLARLVGFALALYAAVYFNEGAAELLQRGFIQDAEPWVARIVAYVIVFLLVYLTIFIASMVLERCMKTVKLQTMNRLLGAGLGLVKVGLLLGVVFFGARHLPHPSTKEMMEKSAIAPVLANGVESLVAALASEYREEIRGGVQDLTKQIRNALAEDPSALGLPDPDQP